MRPLIVITLAMITALASGDRLIDIPTANKLPFGTLREEGRYFPSDRRGLYTFTEFGLGPSFEAGIRTQRLGNERTATTFDLSYNYLVPVQTYSPGIEVGVLDGANTTADGRRVYVATTFDEGGAPSLLEAGAQATIGLQVGRRATPFVGVCLPVLRCVRLLAEHDGFRISAAIEFRPVPTLAVKLIQSDRKLELGLSLSRSFRG